MHGGPESIGIAPCALRRTEGLYMTRVPSRSFTFLFNLVDPSPDQHDSAPADRTGEGQRC
jgi:hypothetical protein